MFHIPVVGVLILGLVEVYKASMWGVLCSLAFINFFFGRIGRKLCKVKRFILVLLV